MSDRDPIKNFEELWRTFNDRYPFFELRNVDWDAQYRIFRPQVTSTTSDRELFDIFSRMLDPLSDGHVELEARLSKGAKKETFTAEKKTKFYTEFTDKQIKKLFKVTEKTLLDIGFGSVKTTKAWMLQYAKSEQFGYVRILELEDVKKKKLKASLDKISADFPDLTGFIIDIRDCPGGEDDIAIQIINRFCDQKRVAFHRRTKIGPGSDDFGKLKTWYLEPEGVTQFLKPVVVLTNDSVFSGGEAFALAIRELPHVSLIGDHTNGIFSYTLDRELPNGWDYCLSYQVYYSADMQCFEGKGVPVDIEVFNTKQDLKDGVDPLIVKALDVLSDKPAPTNFVA